MLIRREDLGAVEFYRTLADDLFEQEPVLDTRHLLLDTDEYIRILVKLISRLKPELLTGIIKDIVKDVDGVAAEIKIKTSMEVDASNADLSLAVYLVAHEAARLASMRDAFNAQNSYGRDRLIVDTKKQKLDMYLSWMHLVIKSNLHDLQVMRDSLCGSLEDTMMKEITLLKQKNKKIVGIIRNAYDMVDELDE
jgi:hypothetical protein